MTAAVDVTDHFAIYYEGGFLSAEFQGDRVLPIFSTHARALTFVVKELKLISDGEQPLPPEIEIRAMGRDVHALVRSVPVGTLVWLDPERDGDMMRAHQWCRD